MFFPDRIFLSAALVLAFAMAALMTPLQIDALTFWALAGILIYVLWLERFMRARGRLRLARFMASFSTVLLVGWLCICIHFAALTFGFSEIDNALLAADGMLGFDWLKLHDWLRDHPLLDALLSVAYASLLPQMIAAIVLLTHEEREDQMREFLAAYSLSLIVAILFASLWPAHAMCRTAGLEHAADPAILARAGCAFLPVYDGLRNGTLTVLEIAHIDGLATFPSFHTTAAILLAWSMRNVPVGRWVFLVLNVLMIAATPTHGGHYLTDVIAGAGLAVVSIALAQKRSGKLRPIFEQTAARFATLGGIARP